MGVLDDAIREHLDLKRRRGADPTEVERAEREALGPVRRAPEIRPGDEVMLDSPPAGESAFDHEDEAWETDPAYDEPPGRGGLSGRGTELEPDFGDDAALGGREHEDEPASGGRFSRLSSRVFGKSEPEHEPEYDEEPDPHPATPAGRGSYLDEPDPAPATPPPHPATAQIRDETVEFDVDAALAAARGAPHPGESELHPAEGELHPGEGELPAAPGDEDVLEETPEFLQDTPDHDRLWFEQRPPRDFDFDG